MFVRLALNMTATFTPFYLTTVCGFVSDEGTSVAIAAEPLVSYTFSLILSVCFQAKITQKFRNRFIPMLMSLVLTTIGSVPFMFLSSDNWSAYLVYPLAAFQGTGIALMLNTGTSLISDVLGKDNESAAFVYGVYSLFDKFANGFLGYILVADYSENAKALKFIIGLIPTLCALFCSIITYYGTKWY